MVVILGGAGLHQKREEDRSARNGRPIDRPTNKPDSLTIHRPSVYAAMNVRMEARRGIELDKRSRNVKKGGERKGVKMRQREKTSV